MRRILQSPAGQSTPELATLNLAHLAAVAIAHEVGHTLGLSHAHEGVMKARLDAEDVAAARRLELGFGASEGRPMRLALQREVLAFADGSRQGAAGRNPSPK